MRHGTVVQRHTRACPRDEEGHLLPHRCRGSWAYVIDLPRSTDGQRKQSTKSGYPTRAAATSALKDRADLLASEFTSHALTVGDYLDMWLRGKHALKESTRAHYGDAIRLYLQPNLGGVRLLDLRAHHLDQLYASIRVGVRGRPLSPASIRRVHACLRSALNTAVKRRLIPYNPALHVELAPEHAQRAHPWGVDECRRFIETTGEDRLHLLYVVLLVTGMRRGEAIGLRWPNVDEQRARLLVTEQVTAVRGRPTTGTPKTRRGTRAIPLDAATVRHLASHRQAQKAERGAWGDTWDPNGLVFTREDGGVLRPEYVTRHFQVLARRVGLPVIRLHDLRHTNASLALEAGVDIKVVSERLGHSTVAITSDLYTHVGPTVGRTAAVKIAELVLGAGEPPQPVGTVLSPGSPAEVSAP